MNIDSSDTIAAGAIEVCAILNRWSGRIEGHQNNRRAHPRFPFEKQLLAYVPELNSAGEALSWEPTPINGRNISNGGIGFLTLKKLPEGEIMVCLEQETVLLGSVVRQRKVHNGYWDVGVQFDRKLDREADSDIWPDFQIVDLDR